MQEIIFKRSWNKRHYFGPTWHWGSNNIAMQLELNSNWIQTQYTEWNLNSTTGLRLNWIDSNSIERKWEWWESYWKSSHEYGVKLFLIKIKNPKKTAVHTSSFENTLNKFQFGIVQPTTTIYETSNYPTETNSNESLSLELISNLLNIWKIITQSVQNHYNWTVSYLRSEPRHTGRSAQHTHGLDTKRLLYTFKEFVS